MKAIAVHALFLIVVMGMITFFLLILFWRYIKIGEIKATEVSCRIKLTNYCEKWIRDKKDPGDWHEIEPKTGCDEFGISRPTSLEECKRLFGL